MFSKRFITRSFPIRYITSNIPGAAERPVSATRAGCIISAALTPSSSAKKRTTSSIDSGVNISLVLIASFNFLRLSIAFFSDKCSLTASLSKKSSSVNRKLVFSTRSSILENLV